MRLDNLFEGRHSMPKRPLGRTGWNVSIFSLGGQGSLESHGNKKNCVGIIRTAFDNGVNYMDTSPIYDDSELYYGEALKGIRNKIFLATKTDKRDRDGSLREIEKSLKRLKTDYIDLWQIHHLDDMGEVDDVTADDGALKALIEMREQKVVRFLGLTGHEHPTILMEAMKRFDFDAVLCPANACDRNMSPSFIDTVVKDATKRKMGTIGMKVFSQGHIFNPDKLTSTWDALMYALNGGVNTVIVGCDDVSQLRENIAIAKEFEELSPKEMRRIESLTASYKKRACFFRKEFGGYGSKDKLE